jgi:hypothetical protein
MINEELPDPPIFLPLRNIVSPKSCILLPQAVINLLLIDDANAAGTIGVVCPNTDEDLSKEDIHNIEPLPEFYV